MADQPATPAQPAPPARSVVTIRPSDNGPYRVRGPIVLEDVTGVRWDLPEGKSVFLCRCGHSRNKPFCDDTHIAMGYQSVVRAPGSDPEG